MRKSTQASIDNKIINQMTDDNHYGWYQQFHGACNDNSNRGEIAKHYIKKIAEKFGKPNKLQAVFEKIYTCEGLVLDGDEKFRKANEFIWVHEDYSGEIITKETYIQRNIYNNSDSYKNELGNIFGYEITFVRETRRAPVDLIGYEFDGKNLSFNIIELKACKAEKIERPANDLLLRALFEVATYRAYFKAVMVRNDELAISIRNQLKDELPSVTIDDIKNASVKLIVLAPDYIINEKDEEYMKDFIKPEISLLTLSAARKFDETATVGSKEKLFNIK